MMKFTVFHQMEKEPVEEFIQSVNLWLEEGEAVDVLIANQTLDINGKLVISLFYELEDDEVL